MNQMMLRTPSVIFDIPEDGRYEIQLMMGMTCAHKDNVFLFSLARVASRLGSDSRETIYHEEETLLGINVLTYALMSVDKHKKITYQQGSIHCSDKTRLEEFNEGSRYFRFQWEEKATNIMKRFIHEMPGAFEEMMSKLPQDAWA